MIGTTAEYSQTLIMMNTAVKSSLPRLRPTLPIDRILSSQMDASIEMARHLESLTAHYDQMAAALKDNEAGEVFSEEDLQGICVERTSWLFAPLTAHLSLAMNRDANELQFILIELEDSLKVIEDSQ